MIDDRLLGFWKELAVIHGGLRAVFWPHHCNKNLDEVQRRRGLVQHDNSGQVHLQIAG
jgi:hypothetical protein